MTDQAQRNLQRNKMLAQSAERGTTQLVRWGADLFRALVKFIQEMIAQTLGK
jgi:hypothetical protein